jgi:hypothetical protein
VPVISPQFTLMNSHIADNGSNISFSELVNFVSGQTFPGATVFTNSTLSGDGSSTSPLTVANEGVGAAQIGSGSAFNGTVLTSNGNGSVSWQSPVNSGGTVQSVGSGLGLTGGPITLSGTLAIDTTVVPQLGASNTFTSANLFAGGTMNPALGTDVAGGTGFRSAPMDLGISTNDGTTVFNDAYRWQAEPQNAGSP